MNEVDRQVGVAVPVELAAERPAINELPHVMRWFVPQPRPIDGYDVRVFRQQSKFMRLPHEGCPTGRLDQGPIDPGVLRATLYTDRYRFGARSIESIVTMSQLKGKVRFETRSGNTSKLRSLRSPFRQFVADSSDIERRTLNLDHLNFFARSQRHLAIDRKCCPR